MRSRIGRYRFPIIFRSVNLMPNYNIVTDSCCDLRPETYEQLNLTVVPLSLSLIHI